MQEWTMKFVINDQMVLLRAAEGPLAPYIVSFSKWAIEQGYAPSSLRQRIRIAVGFSRWLAGQSVRLHNVSSRHCDQYLRYRARQRQIFWGDATALKQLFDFLRAHNVIRTEKMRRRPLSPVERHVYAFGRYLREDRVLAAKTVVVYTPFAREFLKDCFGSAPVCGWRSESAPRWRKGASEARQLSG
jgi:integrase/recombinase XerD